jgi:hypothetical protein
VPIREIGGSSALLLLSTFLLPLPATPAQAILALCSQHSPTETPKY